MPLWRALLSLFSILCLVLTPRAILASPLPPELEPWADWVRARHPALNCPVTAGGASCVWPGELALQVDEDGGSFAFSVRVDREIAVPLPGERGAWPQEVLVDGLPAPVLQVSDKPMVTLWPGEHGIQGSYSWSRLPQGLALPPTVGRIDLVVSGERVPWPHIDERGSLRLGPGESGAQGEERLDIEVSRHISDGLPVRVETRVTLRASGGGRELNLGQVSPPGCRAVSLSADLPARLTQDQELVVQVRPGNFSLRFDALHEGPLNALAAPELPAPWPTQEYWAVTTDDRVRAVNLSGPPAVDPARTPLPDDWRGLPTFLVSSDQALQFEELRRGEPEPAPNRLELSREIWLDADGGGYTFRDRFSGTLNKGWRLDMQIPGELGHVVEQGQDQVITHTSGAADGGSGVELRQAALSMTAESRIEGRPGKLPAVGWDTDVHRLSSTLHLAPGWTLLAASGVDRVPGSLMHDWDLFDLFYVLILSMAAGRLLGWKWSAVALLGLALSRQDAQAPAWAWVFLLAAVGLCRVLPGGWWQRGARILRWVLVLGLLLILVPYAVGQVRTGFFPVLEMPWQSSCPDQDAFDLVPPLERQVAMDKGAAEKSGADIPQQQAGEQYWEQQDDGIGDVLESVTLRSESTTRSSGGLRGKKKAPVKQRHLSLQYDPTSIATTGQGVQEWNWNPEVSSYGSGRTFGGDPALEWSGPVTSEHQIRLFLLGPGGNALLNLLRVALLLGLALRLAGMRSLRLPPRAAGAAALGLLLLPVGARAAPSQELLKELENRLVQPPACAPHCATVAWAALAVKDDQLSITAEVHASAPSSWPIPGPAEVWVPEDVQLDGSRTSAMARLADGFLHVRLDPGVHRLRVEGGLPAADSLTLTFGLAPQRLEWAESPGWTLDGLHADGTAERAVQLTRTLASGGGDSSSSENLAPWVEVRRYLDLGIPWRVRSEVLRIGPADSPLALQVPVLPGEAVTDETLQVEDGRVRVSLDRDRSSISWLSTLEISEELLLVAPEDVPWTEEWVVSCSPVYACRADGPAPLEHVREGRWSPRWRLWPGEQVRLSITRPEAVAGQTVTIDQARLDVTPGRRLSEGQLGLVLRTSQGGQQVISLPPGAQLQQVRIDGQERPIQARGDQLHLPLQPGVQRVKIAWQQPHEPTLFERLPQVDLGSPAVNVGLVLHAPPERCILALFGPPRWGPVPLFWTYVLLVLAAGPLLARLPWVPLRTWHWWLLGLGMTQVPMAVPAIVVIWFVLVGLRERKAPSHWLAFDLLQLGLLGCTFLAALGLYSAIHAGLLLQPDTQIMGNGSSAQELIWFADRTEGALPTPGVFSVPMWSWRVVMLLWALWLVASLLRWSPWAWRAFKLERFYLLPPKPEPPAEVPGDTAP